MGTAQPVSPAVLGRCLLCAPATLTNSAPACLFPICLLRTPAGAWGGDRALAGGHCLVLSRFCWARAGPGLVTVTAPWAQDRPSRADPAEQTDPQILPQLPLCRNPTCLACLLQIRKCMSPDSGAHSKRQRAKGRASLCVRCPPATVTRGPRVSVRRHLATDGPVLVDACLSAVCFLILSGESQCSPLIPAKEVTGIARRSAGEKRV